MFIFNRQITRNLFRFIFLLENKDSLILIIYVFGQCLAGKIIMLKISMFWMDY